MLKKTSTIIISGLFLLAGKVQAVHSVSTAEGANSSTVPEILRPFLANAILADFVGENGMLLLVPLAILFLFLLSGIIITVWLGRQRWKEGMNSFKHHFR